MPAIIGALFLVGSVWASGRGGSLMGLFGDDMPDEVRRLRDAINESFWKMAPELKGTNAAYASKERDGWEVADNFERYFSKIYVYRDGKWFTRTMYSDEPERPYSFSKAMSDARIMYEG
jgi:hypothetical protein